MAGDVLAGRYELLGHLATGGMAEVWEGRDDVLSRPVAVKVMSVTEFVTVSQMKFVVNDSTVRPGLNPPMALTEPRVKITSPEISKESA